MASRLRTWSAFGDINRRPSEYEIVTHAMHYSMRKGRGRAVRGEPRRPR